MRVLVFEQVQSDSRLQELAGFYCWAARDASITHDPYIRLSATDSARIEMDVLVHAVWPEERFQRQHHSGGANGKG